MPTSPTDKRGVVYIFWGEKGEQWAQRSIQSLHVHHPQLPVHCHRIAASNPPGRELREKSRLKSITPFETTLFLDADTVVLGNLDYAFEQAERWGLACTINECPWMRRYGQQGEEDITEYNTGVIAFTSAAAEVFDAWEKLADITPSKSFWIETDNSPHGMEYEDQAGFSRAIRQCNFNPFVLPVNFNFRPDFFPKGFCPLKIWHDYRLPPRGLPELSLECERGVRPVTYFDLTTTQPKRP
jgi:hypothetical protein